MLMAQVIRFKTDRFDVTKEQPNPHNPIAGESLLLWLKDRVSAELTLTEPNTEDWGWYCEVDWHGRTYLLGASASEEETSEREWVLQIEKFRSVKEKLLGRAKMSGDDECASYFQRLIESEPSFKEVSVDEEL